MLITDRRKKLFVKLENVFFSEDYRQYVSDADIVLFLRSSNGISDAAAFNTLQIDLKKSEEILFSEIRKNCRYEINRAERRDELFYSITDQPLDSDINLFCSFYNEFAAAKNLPALSVEQLRTFRELKALTISNIKAKEGDILCSHLYVTDGKRALGLHFPSCFRKYTDKEFRSMVGRANKYLHWQDIRYFKSKGFYYYDFGGLACDSDDLDMTKVDEFKLHFGGNKVVEYDFYYPLTLKGRILLLLSRKKFSE